MLVKLTPGCPAWNWMLEQSINIMILIPAVVVVNALLSKLFRQLIVVVVSLLIKLFRLLLLLLFFKVRCKHGLNVLNGSFDVLWRTPGRGRRGTCWTLWRRTWVLQKNYVVKKLACLILWEYTLHAKNAQTFLTIWNTFIRTNNKASFFGK